MKAFFRKLPNGSWTPHDDDTKKYCDRRNVGQVLSAEIKMARNYANHKRFFDFRNVTFGMQDFYDNDEMYRKWLLLACGWCDAIVMPDGSVKFAVKSMSFDEMEEDDFKKFFSNAIDVFLKHFGNGMTEWDVLQAISYA